MADKKQSRKVWKAPQRWVASESITLFAVNYSRTFSGKDSRILSLDEGKDSLLSVRKGKLTAEGTVPDAPVSRDAIQKEYPLALVDRLKRKEGAGLVLYMCAPECSRGPLASSPTASFKEPDKKRMVFASVEERERSSPVFPCRNTVATQRPTWDDPVTYMP